MLKTFGVALLAIGMSAGMAQAAAAFSLGMARQGHKHTIPGCTMGQQAAVTCACGTRTNGKPSLCQKGQWCHYPFMNVCRP
jgi:hypothetical protein